MSKSQRVKSNVSILKIVVDDINTNEPAKFILFNSGEDVHFRIISKKNRRYNIDNLNGVILKNHYLEISIGLLSSPIVDSFLPDDTISSIILDKEFGNVIQTIELPLKIIMSNQCKSQSFSSLHSISNPESSIVRYRGKPLSDEVHLVKKTNIKDQNESLLTPMILWILKKLVFLIVCSICVLVIVLPLQGFPLTEPHPLDNWVIHLARIWPKHFLPNHLIQYLAILILGAAMAIFLFIY